MLGRGELADFLKKYNLSKDHVVYAEGRSFVTAEVETRYIHDADEFVTVDTEFGTMSLRWGHVVGYVPGRHRQLEPSGWVLDNAGTTLDKA
jgi:hypothetical protein